MKWLEKFGKIAKYLERLVLILVGAAGLTALLFHFHFDFLEAKLYDFRMRTGLQPKPDPQIVLISLDDRTTSELNEFSPLPLNFHTEFLNRLEQLKPKAVGYLVKMNHVSQIAPELFQNKEGNQFVKTAKKMSDRGTPVLIGTPFDVNGEIVPPYPLSTLDHSIAIIHRDGNVFAEDKITRRAITTLYKRPTFHVELARKAGLVSEDFLPTSQFYVNQVDGSYFFFRYRGKSIQGENGYKQFSFVDVLRGKVPQKELQGKIVLVGTLNRDNPSDFAFTPFSRAPLLNPKIVIHANILDAVIHDDGIQMVPDSINWGITFILTAFVIWCVLIFNPVQGVVATFLLAIGFMGVAYLAFQRIGYLQGFWIRESQPLIGIFLSYYLVVPYRLIREYKKRWQYQRRNALLRQVEELKTNFLSLVTHDLKTPVARIQGLAEVLSRHGVERLNQSDQETLQKIVASTDELNHFISSILELTKVESNRINLNLESKDVNQLIEKCVEGFQAQARAKGIKISTNLEPLFPIRIDASLVSKVLNNLIDNALKYSPNDATIHIESKEVGESVEISVADEGIGLTEEEKKNLFTKFYRAKNDTTTKIIGTGLGLYLSKYFIEAHRGRLEVVSEPGTGSLFRMILPQNLDPSEVRPGLTRGKEILDLREKEKTHV